MWVSVYQTTRRHVDEYFNLHIQSCYNFESLTILVTRIHTDVEVLRSICLATELEYTFRAKIFLFCM